MTDSATTEGLLKLPRLEKHSSYSHTIARAMQLAKPYFAHKKTACAHATGLAILCAAKAALNVRISYAQRDFSTSLADKDPDGFRDACWKFVGVIVLAAPLFSGYDWFEGCFVVNWRKWFTEKLLQKYFTGRTYCFLSTFGIDNPDQRFTQDVEAFVSLVVRFALTVFSKMLNMVAFCGILWSISPNLVYVLILYSVVGTFGTQAIFGGTLQQLAFALLKKEANLRFALTRIREHAESIFFYRGGERERCIIQERLDDVVTTSFDQLAANFRLQVFQLCYNYATILVPSLVIAPRYFSGELEFGVISQASMAFGVIRSATAIFVDEYAELSRLSAIIERLDRVSEAMDEMRMMDNINVGEGAPLKPAFLLGDKMREPMMNLDSEDSLLNVNMIDADVWTPDKKRLLISKLSLSLEKGDRLLIVGPSGALWGLQGHYGTF